MQTKYFEIESVVILPDGRMDAKNAARYTGLSEKTMAMMRSGRTGPAYLKRGKIFYFKEDLDAWLSDGRVRPGSAIHSFGME